MPHTRTAGAAPLAAADDPVAAAARAGDEAAFAGLVDRYRRELHVHCYRMLGSLVREDIRITMPPHPWCYDGLAAIAPLLQRGLSDPGVWRLLPTRANRQPAAAGRQRVPGVQAGRAAGGGRRHRRDHHLRRPPVPGLRPADPLTTPGG